MRVLEERDGVSEFDGKSWPEITGLPSGAPREISVAISTALQGTPLLQEYGGPGAVPSEPIIQKPAEAGSMLPAHLLWPRNIRGSYIMPGDVKS